MVKNPIGFFSHFTTPGSPLGLVPFLKIIEVIRIFIRPLTLGVRLAVKLMTGHLLLRMVRNFHSNLMVIGSLTLVIMMFFFIKFLFFYEMSVCLIQGLVYSLMLVQYLDEHSK